MNSLRIPLTTLIIVLFALSGWIVYVYSEASKPQQQVLAADTKSLHIAQEVQSPINNKTTVLTEDTVAVNILGVWQSSDDPNYSVDITSNKTWTDTYKTSNASSSISESGTYSIFTSANPDTAFSGPIAQGVVYIKLIEGADTYFYSVLDAGDSNLQLSYLERGNTLSFVKIR